MVHWVIFLASLAAAQPAPAEAAALEAASVPDTARLEQLNAIWLKSYETRDREALGSVLADDFVGLYGEAALSKQQLLEGLTTRPPTRVDWANLRINVNGDTALVAAISTITTKVGGKEASARYNYVDVYARRNGQWRAIASHVVRLAD